VTQGQGLIVTSQLRSFFFTGALTENTCHKRRHAASWGNVVENSDGFRQNSEIVMKFP